MIRKDLELSLDDRGNVVMTKSTLDKILFIASDELPEVTSEKENWLTAEFRMKGEDDDAWRYETATL